MRQAQMASILKRQSITSYSFKLALGGLRYLVSLRVLLLAIRILPDLFLIGVARR